MKKIYITTFITLLLFVQMNLYPQRIMEQLSHGAVAVKTNFGYFLSWRLLATENREEVSFNILRGNHKISPDPISLTCYSDTTLEAGAYTLEVFRNKTLVGKEEVIILPEGYLEITLKEGNYSIQHAWPGDLNGDGNYDFVVSRLPIGQGSPVLEGYLHDGTFLWRIDMGKHSYLKTPGNGTNDSPPASISGYGNVAGYRDNDNVTVYDLDLNGKAEVLLRAANGVIFNNKLGIPDSNQIVQYLSVVDGYTGNEITRTQLPNDFSEDGPIAGHFGIAYLDGQKPSLVTKLKNRKGAARGSFNLLIAAWDFDGTTLTQRWKWRHTNEPFVSSFHQIRIIDLDQDGKDEICDGSFVIDNDGKFLYSIDNCVHGDRFHITDIDPNRPGLEGYCIQQTENGQVQYHPWFYYDAATGKTIRHGGEPRDIGRGTVADVDPRYPGHEMWADDGIYSISGEKISEPMPEANFRIWWDGDLLSEILDRNQIMKWNYLLGESETLFHAKNTIHAARNAPPLYGDLFGDWREEVLWETADHKAFRIYTTSIPTIYSFYTLPHNPAYRACMTVKGYYQSNFTDFYLGKGMEQPKSRNITIPSQSTK